MKYVSNSREYQDMFVLSVLGGKKNGTYLEVGAAHYMTDSNTFLLEDKFGWTGISVEWNADFSEQFNKLRTNKCICEDARLLDYDSILSQISNTNHIDYLQLDVDPPEVTFDVLKKIDFNKYSFSVITFEHDAWRGSIVERDLSREIITSYGYTPVILDVMHGPYEFEDWYVNKNYMVDDTWKKFAGNKIQMNLHNISTSTKNLLTEIMNSL